MSTENTSINRNVQLWFRMLGWTLDENKSLQWLALRCWCLADPRSLQVRVGSRRTWPACGTAALHRCSENNTSMDAIWCHLTLHPRHKCRWPEEGVQQSSGWLALESLEKYDLICDASKLRREVTRFLRRVNITQFVTLITCAWDGWLLVQQNTRRDGFIMCYWQQACLLASQSTPKQHGSSWRNCQRAAGVQCRNDLLLQPLLPWSTAPAVYHPKTWICPRMGHTDTPNLPVVHVFVHHISLQTGHLEVSQVLSHVHFPGRSHLGTRSPDICRPVTAHVPPPCWQRRASGRFAVRIGTHPGRRSPPWHQPQKKAPMLATDWCGPPKNF